MAAVNTILLVDDEKFVRECMTDFFEDDGFIVHTADNAEDALEMMARFCPQICITDLNLSGMNGEAFILKAIAICPGCHFMIHTGEYYLLPDSLKAIGMTPDDVLLKPIHDFFALSALIKAAIAAGRAA